METISRSDSPRSINCGMSLEDQSEKSETQEQRTVNGSNNNSRQNASVAASSQETKKTSNKMTAATQQQPPSSPRKRTTTSTAPQQQQQPNGRVTRPRPGLNRNGQLEPQLSARWLSDRSQSLRHLPGRVSSEKAPRLPGRGRQVESDSEEEETVETLQLEEEEDDKSDNTNDSEEVEEPLDASANSNRSNPNDEAPVARKAWTPRKRFVTATRSSDGPAFGNGATTPRGGRKPFVPRKRFPKVADDLEEDAEQQKDSSSAVSNRQAAAPGIASKVAEQATTPAARVRNPITQRKRRESLSMLAPVKYIPAAKEDTPPAAAGGRKPFKPRGRRLGDEEEAKPNVAQRGGLATLKDEPIGFSSRRQVTDDKPAEQNPEPRAAVSHDEATESQPVAAALNLEDKVDKQPEKSISEPGLSEEEPPKRRTFTPRKRFSRDTDKDSEGPPLEDNSAPAPSVAEQTAEAGSTDYHSDDKPTKLPEGGDNTPKAAPRRRLSNESTESPQEDSANSEPEKSEVTTEVEPEIDASQADQAPNATTRRYSSGSDQAEPVTTTSEEAETAPSQAAQETPNAVQADAAPRAMRRRCSGNSTSASRAEQRDSATAEEKQEPSHADAAPAPMRRRLSDSSVSEAKAKGPADETDEDTPSHVDSAPKPMARRRLSESSVDDKETTIQADAPPKAVSESSGSEVVEKDPSHTDAAPKPLMRRQLSDSSSSSSSDSSESGSETEEDDSSSNSSESASEDEENEPVPVDEKGPTAADAAPKPMVRRRMSESSQAGSTELCEKDDNNKDASGADAAPKPMIRRRLSEGSDTVPLETNEPIENAAKPNNQEPMSVDAAPKPMMRRRLSDNSESSTPVADEAPKRKSFKPKRIFTQEDESPSEETPNEPVAETNETPTRQPFKPRKRNPDGPAVAEAESLNVNKEAGEPEGRGRKPFQPRKRFGETKNDSGAKEDVGPKATAMRSPRRAESPTKEQKADDDQSEQSEDDFSEGDESSESSVSADDNSLESDSDSSGSGSDDEASETESAKSTVQELSSARFEVQPKNQSEDTITSDDETTHRRGGVPMPKETDSAMHAPRRLASHDSDSESSTEKESTRKRFTPRNRRSADSAPAANATQRWGTGDKAEEPTREKSQRRLFTPRKRNVARPGSSTDDQAASQPKEAEASDEETPQRKPFKPRTRATSPAEDSNLPQRKASPVAPIMGVSDIDAPIRPERPMGPREMSGRWSSEHDEGATWEDKSGAIPAPPRTPRRPGSQAETESSSHDSAPQRRAMPQRTNSKSLRFTPERTTSFSRQAPGRMAPSNDNMDDPNSVTVLTRDLPGRVAPGRAVSMSATGLSSLSVQRMASNAGLRQMASAVKSPVRQGNNDLQRNVPGRTISSKALRVTPERTRSGLRRQAPGQNAGLANDQQHGQVTLLERSGPGRTPLRAASMGIAHSRRVPQRTVSSMRREALAAKSVAPINEDGDDGEDAAPTRPPRFSERSAPMRAASMSIAQTRQARQAPLRTISSLRRQALAEKSVPAISEGGDSDEPPQRRAPARTISSMRRQALADQSVPAISEGGDYNEPTTRRAPARTVSSMRREALAAKSVAPISEDETPTRATRFSERSAPMRAASMGLMQSRRAPARTVSSMRREALAAKSVAPIREDETPTRATRFSERSAPMRAASMSLAHARRDMGARGASGVAAPSLPSRSAEPERSAPGRTISSKALRVTPERTISGLRRQLPGSRGVTGNNEGGEITVLERSDPGRAAPMRAASMGLSMMRRAPQRSVSGLRRQMPTPTDDADPHREVPSILDQMRPAAPMRAASMSLSVMRSTPQRSTSGLRRQAPQIQNEPQRGAPGRTISSKALRVTPERTMSGLRRQAPGRSSAASDDDPGSVTVLEREDNGSRSAPIRAASMNLAAMRRLASSVDNRPTGQMEPQRGAPGRTISSKALRVTPERTTSGLRRGNPSGSAPARASSMRVPLGPAASFRVQRQESMAGLRRMAEMANANAPSSSDEPQRSVPSRTISAKSLRVTPERTTSLRRQPPGRSAPPAEVMDGEITVLERDNSTLPAENSPSAEPGRRLPPRTSSSSLRQRQAPGRSFSGLASRAVPARGNSFQRQSPGRASSMSVTSVTRQLPERTSSNRQRMAPARASSGMGMRQLPARTSSGIGARQLPSRTSSGVGMRQVPTRTSSRQQLAAIVTSDSEDKHREEESSESEETIEDILESDNDEEEDDQLAPLQLSNSAGMDADLGLMGGGVRRESLLTDALVHFYSEGIMEESSENADTTEEDTEVSIEAYLRSTDLMESVEEDAEEVHGLRTPRASMQMPTILGRSGIYDLMEDSQDSVQSSSRSDDSEDSASDQSSTEGEDSDEDYSDDESTVAELVLVDDSDDDESSAHSDSENDDEILHENIHEDNSAKSSTSTHEIKDAVTTIAGTVDGKSITKIYDESTHEKESSSLEVIPDTAHLESFGEAQKDNEINTQEQSDNGEPKSNGDLDIEPKIDGLGESKEVGQTPDPKDERDIEEDNKLAPLSGKSNGNSQISELTSTSASSGLGGSESCLNSVKDTVKDEDFEVPTDAAIGLINANAAPPGRRGSFSSDEECSESSDSDSDFDSDKDADSVSEAQAEERSSENHNTNQLEQVSEGNDRGQTKGDSCTVELESEDASRLAGTKATEELLTEKSEVEVAVATPMDHQVAVTETKSNGSEGGPVYPPTKDASQTYEEPLLADHSDKSAGFETSDNVGAGLRDDMSQLESATKMNVKTNVAPEASASNDKVKNTPVDTESGGTEKAPGDDVSAATAPIQTAASAQTSFLWHRGVVKNVGDTKGPVNAGREAVQSVAKVNTIVSVKFIPEQPPNSAYWPKPPAIAGLGSEFNACPKRRRSTNFDGMPPLDDVGSVKDDESMPALDDYASVRDDESMLPDDESMPPLDGMSVRDDESMPDGQSVRDDESMPPLSDVASASVQQDDESMPAFDDETTVKDDDISKSENDDDDDGGHDHLSGGFQNNRLHGVPPIISTELKSAIRNRGQTRAEGGVPPVIDTSMRHRMSAVQNSPPQSQVNVISPISQSSPNTADGKDEGNDGPDAKQATTSCEDWKTATARASPLVIKVDKEGHVLSMSNVDPKATVTATSNMNSGMVEVIDVDEVDADGTEVEEEVDVDNVDELPPATSGAKQELATTETEELELDKETNEENDDLEEEEDDTVTPTTESSSSENLLTAPAPESAPIIFNRWS